jgi:protein-tyrosine phosphatase
MVSSTQERFLPFQSCLNFRDLGGYAGLHNRPVRWGRVFRSMTPEFMTAADAERALALDIGLVIDFRGDRFETSGPLGEPPARRITAGPTFLRNPAELPPDVAAFMTQPPDEALPRLLSVYGPSFAEAVNAMAANLDVNVLFHCRLGKDRTGVFAALLLKLLRVSDTDVIEDYMLTEWAEPQMKRFLNSVEDAGESREPRVAREPVDRRAMECVLERLESQYGTAYNYFLRHGVKHSDLNALIESLLETEPRAGEATRRTPFTAAALSRN